MFSLRVNFQTKVLVTETADMCGLKVSDILRVVSLWVARGRVTMSRENRSTIAVSQKGGNVINYEIPKNYHANLDDFITADIKMPDACASQREFRSCIVAACLDTQSKARADYERKCDFDRQLKETQLQSVRERAALLGVL